MDEYYFKNIVQQLFSYPYEKIELDKLDYDLSHNLNFETLIILSEFITSESVFYYINENKFVHNKEIYYDFLLFKLTEYLSQKSQNFRDVFDNELLKNISEGYTRKLYYSNKSKNGYIDDLCVRIDYLGCKIQTNRKDNMLSILEEFTNNTLS